MATILLDSSVLVKWFIEEAGSDRASSIYRHFLAGRLSLAYAELSLFEVANALHFSGRFTAHDIAKAMTALQTLNMQKAGFDSRALNRAAELAAEHGTAIYDGYLVALAEQNRWDFLTADQRLLRRLIIYPFVYDFDLYPLPLVEDGA